MKDDNQLKQENPELYKVARNSGTEAPYAGKYVHEKAKGMYKCAVCGQTLFSSDAKFDAEAGPAGLRGWPSFDQAIPGSTIHVEDNSMGMHRTEIQCSNCKAHLGHIFDDDTAPTGKHYCINSVCLDLAKEEKNENN